MTNSNLNQQAKYKTAVDAACAKIAPSWSLENMVAVNPYMGMSHQSFSSAANAYHKMAKIDLLMPMTFYLQLKTEGKIQHDDIEAALIKNGHNDTTVNEFIETASSIEDNPLAEKEFFVKTVAETLCDISGNDWRSFILDRISNWAAAYFDKGQSFWKTTNQHDSMYAAWLADAIVDRSPSIMGLKNFTTELKRAPKNQEEAINLALDSLNISKENIDTYLHALLLKFGGWASYAAGIDWDNNLYGGTKTNLESFLAILLIWEMCLLKTHNNSELKSKWEANLSQIADHKNMQQFNRRIAINLIFQDALDFSRERELLKQFNANIPLDFNVGRPKAQAIFCIDVRSEIYRRQLEQVDRNIETIGFAGFFGFPISIKGIGQSEGTNQCPALIPSGPIVQETLSNNTKQELARNRRLAGYQIDKFWKRFKTGAISGFSFVSPMGLYYIFKLITDSFGITRPSANPNTNRLTKKELAQKTVDVSTIAIEDQVAMAKGALTGMGLTKNFAPIVLITGHGSDTVNNPHATGLDCGACGGHSGAGNAMTAEVVLNNPKIRDILATEGIEIPADTYFIAALHNTTTDNITILSEHLVPESHQAHLESLKKDLSKASSATRHERATRMAIKTNANTDQSVIARSKDWSTVRPEWGLAGCNAFVIAPRQRTASISLDGKSFLHNYSWENDHNFNVLESIMTAPMVVTSWINLQYYASTVDNQNFGSGNKNLHNVKGGFGVLEGGSGDLRIGLAMQSVHDGETYQHIPYRLKVIIEAPTTAINQILTKHKNVKALFDNEWIGLLTLNADGKIEKRYTKNLNWEDVTVNENAYAEVKPNIKNKINA
ncbi:MAG: DUF2309 domain-containing protein [Putridiphycobacter sp.]|nr:DUF2309 domain-containing protein [Putridiphycobacter sp.]